MPGLSMTIYVKRDFAPLEERVRSIIAILNQSPPHGRRASKSRGYAAAAVCRDGHPGRRRFRGFSEQGSRRSARFPQERALRSEFNAANQRAVAELRAYSAWLKAEKLPRANDDYALGRERYAMMLRGGELHRPPAGAHPGNRLARIETRATNVRRDREED